MKGGESKYYFDQDAADRVVTFIETYCSHTKGDLAGQPFILEDWQKKDILWPLFGIKHKDTGKRRYKTCYVEIPRKNGKSSLAAALALYLLLADGEKGAEIVSAAADRGQARIIYEIAADMIRNHPELQKRCTILQSRIKFGTSFYQSISAESNTKHGFNCSAVIFDELHAQKRGRDLWDVLGTSVLSRSQPIILALTTAGDDVNSIGFEVHEYARKVKTGEIKDETFLPVLYCADPEDDWTDPAVWAKANPGLGTTCSQAYFETYVNRIEQQPSELYTFQRLHLNIWTDAQDTAWIQDHDFMQGAEDMPPDEHLQTLPCWAGLDLASTRDLTAFAMIWRDGQTYYLKAHSFVPEATAADRKKYRQFADAGHMTVTAGNVVDYDVIMHHILEASEKYNIRAVAYDRKFSAYIVPKLMEAGVNLEPFGQGFLSLSHPTKMMERLLVGGDLVHGGNEVLRWQFSCVQIARDPADNIKPTKNRNKAGEMIDAVVASIMALGQSETEQDTEPESFEIWTL